jgi:hypothetical protein
MTGEKDLYLTPDLGGAAGTAAYEDKARYIIKV